MCGVSLDPLLNNFEGTVNKKFPFQANNGVLPGIAWTT